MAVEHFEARHQGSTVFLPGPRCTLKGDSNVAAFVDKGEAMTAFCHDAGWLQTTCDRFTLVDMREWVPCRWFFRRLDLEEEDAFCVECVARAAQGGVW